MRVFSPHCHLILRLFELPVQVGVLAGQLLPGDVQVCHDPLGFVKPSLINIEKSSTHNNIKPRHLSKVRLSPTYSFLIILHWNHEHKLEVVCKPILT